MRFLHTYIHDSKVGFLSNAEPFSYFSKRGVSESTRSVQGWFEHNIARPVDKAYETTVDAASRGIEKGAEATKKAQEATIDAAKKVEQAASAAAQKVQQAAQSTAEAISKGTQEAISMVKQAWGFLN